MQRSPTNPPAYTDHDVWEFIRARINRQRSARQKRTLNFEVAINENGGVTSVTFQPPKEIIERK